MSRARLTGLSLAAEVRRTGCRLMSGSLEAHGLYALEDFCASRGEGMLGLWLRMRECILISGLGALGLLLVISRISFLGSI